ncbi:unnamed protein product, partial [Laminaria digitata]
GAIQVSKLSSSLHEMAPGYDVVVVGSGYGGGVAALRAAQSTDRDGAPLRVCVLERGHEYAPGEFPTEEISFLRELNSTRIVSDEDSSATPRPELSPRGGGENGKLFDYYQLGGLDALVGNGLGGTSLINAAVAMWPEPAVFSA